MLSRHRNTIFWSQRSFPVPAEVLVRVPTGGRNSGAGRNSHALVFSKSLSDLGSQWYFKAEKLEKVFLCLVPRGCLLFCMFVLFSCLYFTLLKRDFLLFRPVYFCFSLQGVCGNVLNQLCFWKNHNVALKLGALSVSTYSVVFVPAWDACDTEIFSVCFSGGGLKT